MLRKEDILMIKALNERGVYQKDIAEQLGVHPRTFHPALDTPIWSIANPAPSSPNLTAGSLP